MGHEKPLLVHLTTTDISLALLLGPQLQAFLAAGYDVVGVSAAGPFVPEIEAAGVRHIELKHGTRSMAPHRDLLAMAELRSLFRRLRPDIVHTHNPKPGVYGRLAAWAARVPVVVNTVHGLYALPEDPWPKRAVVYGLEAIASRCSQAELLQNEEDLPVLRRLRVPSRKLTVLGNGIDLRRFDRAAVPDEEVAAARAAVGAGPDDVVIGAVGRLVWEKGYRELLDAAALVRADHPEARFVVIGPHDPEKADAVTAADVAAAEAVGVQFLGMRDDVEALYPAMDLYVLATYREGFPRSAMEAAAMGVPIVATDVRGCRQVVDHGTTGLLVPPRDAAALAAALAELVVDRPRREAMGVAAITKAQRSFDQQQVIDTTLGTYERLLARAAR